MERFLKLSKENFVGKQATLRQSEGTRSLQLVYFETDADHAEIRGNEPIFHDHKCIGITTSGGYGYRTSKNLGFGYIPPDLVAESSFQIDLVGKRCNIHLLDKPVYDPSNTRLRA
ncbi:MAG: glycine cleavage T C-terminal barrel domain-containing protein [Pseudomonadota bacterium]